MTFILVTGSVMTVSIFLIYHLCRFIGIEMNWISLVLCAVMSFLVNVTAISMSPFLDRSHYLRLCILVIAAAAFVTFFNEQLLQREEKASAASEMIDPQPWNADQPLVSAASAADISASKLADSSTGREPSAPSEPPEREKQPAVRTETAENPRKTAEDISAAKIEAKAEKVALARAAAKAEALVRAKALQAEKDEAQKRAAEERKARQEAEKRAEESARQKAHEKDAALTAIRHELAAMDSLDNILDYIYEHTQTSPRAAICAYQQAIARYPEDSYTPFLVIELGNLYKGQAAYAEALTLYRQALSLPIIATNDDMRQEFIKNTHYLTIVQDILSKHHTLSTPFPDIPADIMQEIETEFQQSS